MTFDPKTQLHHYLREGRRALLSKLEGLGEYEVRRPLTPTGTNLLGVLKHVGTMEALYFGECFGRPFGEPMPWAEDDAEPNADMWAANDESSEYIVGFYDRACKHADTTIEALAVDAPGHVRWWTTHEVTLHRILVHMTAETHRHAGHADIVRELIDGSAGWLPGDDNLPDVDAAWWESYRRRLEQTARQAAGT